MIIRPATLSDLHALQELAICEASKYERLKPDSSKIRDLATTAISTAKHFCWVVEDEKRVLGALVAFTQENAWAQRQNCGVMLWTSFVPGGGAALLRQFRDWVLSRRAIRVAGFAPDLDVDERVWQLAERIGFKKHGGAYLLYNGGGHGPV